MSVGVPSGSAQVQKMAGISTTSDPADLGIESTNINTTAGVQLSAQQKVIVGSVLDVRPQILILPEENLTDNLYSCSRASLP